jgi:hypothetical protein
MFIVNQLTEIQEYEGDKYKLEEVKHEYTSTEDHIHSKCKESPLSVAEEKQVKGIIVKLKYQMRCGEQGSISFIFQLRP